MNYYDKYVKYKIKYSELKNILEQKGGDMAYITNINNINLFSNTDMEEYLNPIYGKILCFNGFIKNNYFLKKGGFIDNDYSKIITKYTKELGLKIIPNNNMMKLTPFDIGCFIGLKYIYKIDETFFNFNEKKGKISYPKITQQKDYDFFSNKMSLFNNNYSTKIFRNNDIFIFHFLLYCLWWVANNDKGITQYYDGLYTIFCIYNSYNMNKTLLDGINQNKYNDTNSFENIIFQITSVPFNIYNQEQSYNFCVEGGTYPDCYETTARNLINLICFDDNKYFDIEKLRHLNPINELEQYYTKFNNFEKQSSFNKIDIYDLKLNSRDAWSKLIIDYASNNVSFKKKCFNEKEYEIKTGLSIDRSNINFFQVLKNLLPNLNNFDDLKLNGINNITNKIDERGIGELNIEHNIFGIISIEFKNYGHAYMKIHNNYNKYINYQHFGEEKKSLIKELLKEDINEFNYLKINFTSELLTDEINYSKNKLSFKKKLFELSLTEQFDDDTRRRINIDTDNEDFFDYIVYIDQLNKCFINKYTFICSNFDFVDRISKYSSLNINFIRFREKIEIDLSKLSCLTSIDNYFMSDCRDLEIINLSPLSNVITIGNCFLTGCIRLRIIDLSSLSKVISIGDSFLSGCKSLTEIDLSPLHKISSIDDFFLAGCKNLEFIDLSSLSNVLSINDGFLIECVRLVTIDLSPLHNIMSIGDDFLSGCKNLKFIDLSSFSNVLSINDGFLSECVNLQSIDLSQLSNVSYIGNNFLYECKSLKEINLLPLSKITFIDDRFLSFCEKLEYIDLSQLSNVLTIGNSFLAVCENLKSIDLSSLSNVSKIGNDFLAGCKNLKSIDLSQLSNVLTIGNSFLSVCKNLKSIDLSSLSNVSKIGDDFLSGCASITEIDLSPLSNITIIGDNFLSGCQRLTKIICSSNQYELLDMSIVYNKKIKIEISN